MTSITSNSDIDDLIGEGEDSGLPYTYKNLFHALEFDEAAQCLQLLGKEQSGLRYAYLLMAAMDKYLTDISVITEFKHILFVNVSGNRLLTDHIKCLSQLPFILTIQCDRNLIDDGNIGVMKYLQVLTLNDNMIRTPTGICQPLLECLELNNNQITDISELNGDDVPKLKVLTAKSNLITTLHPLNFQQLDSLYLADNKIKIVIDLSQLVNLRILHLRKNRLTRMRGYSSTMTKLEYINVRENNIKKYQRFQKLRCLPNLQTLIFIGNPCMPAEAGEEEEDLNLVESEYGIRIQILRMLPTLKRINKKPITFDEQEIVKEYIDEQGNYIEEEESPEGSSFQDLLLPEDEEDEGTDFAYQFESDGNDDSIN